MITLMNLLSGIISIYLATSGDLIWSAYFIFLAAVFDFLDGFTARLLNAKSAIGLQLDSLADVVSFGVAPGFIMFQMISLSIGSTESDAFLPFLGFMIPLFSALRLAKFNVDENQTDSFLGVPTPAIGLLVAAFPIIVLQSFAENQGLYYDIVINTYFLAGITIVASLLMVSNIPLFALKFKSFSWKKNEVKYIFAILALLLVIFLGFAAVPLIVFLYIILSVSILLICSAKKQD